MWHIIWSIRYCLDRSDSRNRDLGTKVNVPGRQLRLDNQPSPATSYWNYEVVFFDGSTVNLLEFKSPEEFFDAFQVPKNNPNL